MKIENPKDCIREGGEDCCIFLVCGADGFECAKVGSLRETILSRKENMNAQREPDISTPYPECQKEN